MSRDYDHAERGIRRTGQGRLEIAEAYTRVARATTDHVALRIGFQLSDYVDSDSLHTLLEAFPEAERRQIITETMEVARETARRLDYNLDVIMAFHDEATNHGVKRDAYLGDVGETLGSGYRALGIRELLAAEVSDSGDLSDSLSTADSRRTRTERPGFHLTDPGAQHAAQVNYDKRTLDLWAEAMLQDEGLINR